MNVCVRFVGFLRRCWVDRSGGCSGGRVGEGIRLIFEVEALTEGLKSVLALREGCRRLLLE